MRLVVFVLAMTSSGIALAQSAGTSETGIRYNEVAVGYSGLSASGTTLSGYSLSGSALVEKNFLLDASYTDVSKSSTSLNSTGLSVGYRTSVSSNVDAAVRVGYVGNGGASTGSSYIVGAGVNALIAPNVVLGGGLAYTGLDSGLYLYNASLGYYVTDSFTIRASVRVASGDSNNTTYGLSAGYNF